jgi:hypothetical protein
VFFEEVGRSIPAAGARAGVFLKKSVGRYRPPARAPELF